MRNCFFYYSEVNKTIKGTVRQKNEHISKKEFFTSTEVSTCSGCCCGILHLCVVCKWGLGRVERHYNPSIFKEYLQINRSPEKFQFCKF